MTGPTFFNSILESSAHHEVQALDDGGDETITLWNEAQVSTCCRHTIEGSMFLGPIPLFFAESLCFLLES